MNLQPLPKYCCSNIYSIVDIENIQDTWELNFDFPFEMEYTERHNPRNSKYYGPLGYNPPIKFVATKIYTKRNPKAKGDFINQFEFFLYDNNKSICDVWQLTDKSYDDLIYILYNILVNRGEIIYDRNKVIHTRKILIMFKQSCYIEKNTLELRKELEKIGYKYGGNDSSYVKPKALYCYYDSYYECMQKPSRYNSIVNCKDNETLFLAIAALRDDNDNNQWFTDGTLWEKSKKLPSHYMQLEGHKATVKEIIEHFNN